MTAIGSTQIDAFAREPERGAIISPCGLYRYRLWRRWAPGPTCLFIMLNPSTADAEADDPTIRRCIGFAKREGCGRLDVVNLFALRATRPADLWATGPDTRIGGPQSEIEFHRAVRESDLLVAAWGADTRTAERWIIERYGPRLFCLGWTKNGAPRHPLYVKGDCPIVPLITQTKDRP